MSSSETPNNPSVVSFVKYIRPDLDLEEIEDFVNKRQGQGDVYEEALNIGKWQTVERPKKKESEVEEAQQAEKPEQRQYYKFGRGKGSRGRGAKRDWVRGGRPSRKGPGGGPARAFSRNNSHHRSRTKRHERADRGPRHITLPAHHTELSIPSPCSDTVGSSVANPWKGNKSFADCCRGPKTPTFPPSKQESNPLEPSPDPQPPSRESPQSSAMGRKTTAQEMTPLPTPPNGSVSQILTSQPTSTSPSGQSPQQSSLSKESAEADRSREESNHYDPVSGLHKLSDPSTTDAHSESHEDSSLQEPSYRHSQMVKHRKPSQLTPLAVSVEQPTFPYRLQKPHEDHRILDPMQILQEFGASRGLSTPSASELPPGISGSMKKQNLQLKDQVSKLENPSPSGFKIKLPQNFKATKKMIEDLTNSFMSAPSWMQSGSGVQATKLSITPATTNSITGVPATHTPSDEFNIRQITPSTCIETTTPHPLYHPQFTQHSQQNQVLQQHGTVMGPVLGVQDDLLDSTVPQTGVRSVAQNPGGSPLLVAPQYTSIPSYPLALNSNHNMPDLSSYSKPNLDPNAVPWRSSAGWPPHCPQPYQLPQSYNPDIGYIESGLFGKHSISARGSLIRPMAYLQKFTSETQQQIPYAPASNNDLNAFWNNPGPSPQLKDHLSNQPSYNYYSRPN